LAHCQAARDADTFGGMSRTEIMIWILALIVLEIYHLKWIWWENWSCKSCTAKHKDCECAASKKWIMYL
jgi:hypothetical protein